MFFDRFDMLCKQKHVSCRKAIEDIGLSNSIATKWKMRGTTPNGKTLVRIADYFGITVAELMSNETEKSPAPKSEGVNIDEILDGLTDEQLLNFINLATKRLIEKNGDKK